MKFKKLTALLLSASMAVGLLAGCGGTPSNTETGTPSTGDPGTEATGSAASGESSLKGKRVRVVIGSTSTGGDSYMIADMVTRYLGEEMVPVQPMVIRLGLSSPPQDTSTGGSGFRRVLPFQLCLLIRDISFRREPMCAPR